jgi:hypothetical protein
MVAYAASPMSEVTASGYPAVTAIGCSGRRAGQDAIVTSGGCGPDPGEELQGELPGTGVTPDTGVTLGAGIGIERGEAGAQDADLAPQRGRRRTVAAAPDRRRGD